MAPVSAAIAFIAFSASNTLTPAAAATSPTVHLPPSDPMASMTGSRRSLGSCSDSTMRLGAPGLRTSVSAIARVLVARDPRVCARVGACVGAKPMERGANEGFDD